MGKGKEKRRRKKAERKLKNKQARDNDDGYGQTRRNFLKWGISGTLGIGGLYLLGNSFSNDEWDFLRDDLPDFEGTIHSGNPSDYNSVIKKYIPLGKKQDLTPDNPKSIKLDNRARLGIERYIRTLERGDYRYNFTETIYGIPSDHRFIKPHMDYAKKLIELFNEWVDGFSIPDIKWTGIKEGDNFSNNFNRRGYLINNSILAYRAEIVNRKNPKNIIMYPMGGTEYYFGGKGIISRKSSDPYWYFMLSTGYSAIVSPLSEGIPLVTWERDSRLIKELSVRKTSSMMEAISEGIGYCLARELSEELGIPRREEILGMVQDEYKKFDRYKLVPSCIRWLDGQGKKGPQRALDIYMNQGPEKFIETITNS